MHFDLNVPVPTPATLEQNQFSKKSKGKQPAGQISQSTSSASFSPVQISRIEARVDLLVRLGYTVLAFTQTVETKVDPKTHVNILGPLLSQLRKREGILYLKRLTIVLDETSEKGNGMTASNASLFASYDIIALHPTTANTFSSACLTHTAPSALTAHIISLPLTTPRLPFRLKHTMVRTALKNGGVFEINYNGALAAEDARRNWWASAREVVRVSKGKGVIVSGGTDIDVNLRAPKDAGNLMTLLGLSQNLAHDASTVTPKSIIIRAQTRRTYRAILSEPLLIMPSNASGPSNETGTAFSETRQSQLPQFAQSSASAVGRKRTSDSLDKGQTDLASVTSQTLQEGAEIERITDGIRKKKKKNKGRDEP